LIKTRTKNEHIKNRRWFMGDLVQDVVSLVSMSMFLVSAAMWIGAL
jgi:hypothetical protein